MDKIDEQVNNLFQLLRKEQEQFEKAKKESEARWVTNGSIQFDGCTPINIQTASIETIHSIAARLLQYQDYHLRASRELDIPFNDKLGGYTIEEWMRDCRRRIAKLSLEKKKASLDALESRLQAVVSPEQRRALEINELSKALGAT